MLMGPKDKKDQHVEESLDFWKVEMIDLRHYVHFRSHLSCGLHLNFLNAVRIPREGA